MRVAYVCTDQGIPVFGRKGCSIHVQEVMRALIGLGAQVDLFTPRNEGEPPLGLESVQLHPLPIAAQKNPAAREQMAFEANSHLRQALERAGPFDLVYERYSLWSYEAMDYAQAARVPGLLEINAPLIAEQAHHRVLVDRPRAEWVAHRAFGNATALIAVSQEVATYLGRFPDVEGRVQVIPNGVNPDRFPADLPPSFPGATGTFTVGFLGTLKPWHGLQTLVQAFDRLHAIDPALRLLLVGDGPQRSCLQDDLTTRGLQDAVHFTGSVDPTEVPGLLASMEAAVAPYPNLGHFYFSPLKVYEYMAAGCAVVASRIGQLDGLIEHEVTGLLCTPGDARELAGALRRLRGDPALRDRLGQAARAKVRQAHTWDATVRRILQLAGMVPKDGLILANGAAS
jgi:glycosyltransferase involved in cell wall biosynthesis